MSCAGEFIVLGFLKQWYAAVLIVLCFWIRSQLSGSESDPDISHSSDCYSLSIPPVISPRFTPFQSVGKITLGGAYRVGPTWPSRVDTSLFVVCRGDVQSECVLLLSPIDLCVQLGSLVSHQRDYSLFTTSFVVFRDIESGLSPPFLAIPHFLQLPIPLSSWTQFLCRIDWRRSWLRDISRFPIQVMVNIDIKEVGVAEFEQKPARERRGLDSESASDGCTWDETRSIMSGSEADRSELGSDGDGSELGRFEAESSETDSFASSTYSFAGYTDSIEDLVGAAWLHRKGWLDEIPDC